jgi:hypothetical protein
MAILDYAPKGDLWTAVLIGAGLLAAPVVIPMVGAVAKPVAKGVMKTGLMVYQKGNEMIGDFVEGVQDLIAEAKSEVQAELTSEK